MTNSLTSTTAPGLATVNIADSNTGTDRTAMVATASAAGSTSSWALQPEEAAFVSGAASAAPTPTGTFALQPQEAAFVSGAVSVAPATDNFALQSGEAAFIAQSTSPTPSVVADAPVCVAGAAC